MKELYLIFINYIGKDYKGFHIYEFLFSDVIENVDGEDWDVYPASGIPQPPHEHFIKRVGKLESNLKLDVVQNSYVFAVWDAIDGVIALGWENITDYESYPEHRLSFRFGDDMESVEAELYERDLILLYNDKKYEKQK